jgi:chromosome segregation ATPase
LALFATIAKVYLCGFSKDLMKTLDIYEPKVKFLLLNGESILAKTPETVTTGLHQNLDDLKTRWDNIQSAVSGRRGHLEEALKTAENFQESLNRAMAWLSEIERAIAGLKPVSRVLSTLQEQRQELKVKQCYLINRKKCCIT